MNPIRQLGEAGQSVWLDYIRRGLILSGELSRLIAEDGLKGVTSNPAIFEKAISGSSDYAPALAALAGRAGLVAKDRYETLAVRDIQDAADVLLAVYHESKRRDGYVSLEVAPDLAHDTAGTVAEAERLWRTVGRDNVMIKVPATEEGIAAIRSLIAAGINVNVTLLFARAMYERVAEAYISGLEDLAASGGSLGRVGSVASFFVSRIDNAIDALIGERLKAAAGEEQERLRALAGKVAIANARLAYQSYKRIFAGPRWQALAAKGAMTQRVLWASTSTKNPRYRDVLYVEELIGPDTVNTIPPATFDAFRDHGKVRASLEEGVAEAEATLAGLAAAGISLEQVTDGLLIEAVRLFQEPFAKLLEAIEKQGGAGARPARGSAPAGATLPAPLEAEVRRTLAAWKAEARVQRLWARDATLWTGGDEAKWLGWLGIVDEEIARAGRLQEVAREIKQAGFTHAALLGMGGSSLCPEVLRRTFGRIEGWPDLSVLDSTDPAAVRNFERKLDLGKTLFIVSSKSGSTLEPNIFLQYFLARTREVVGAEAPRHFVAITDPGSKLHEQARSLGFRHVFLGQPTIGGRYSALSAFGVVPAALVGLDLGRLLGSAAEMVAACAAFVPPEENPGVRLGVTLGVAALGGRDKLTLIASPGLRSFGAWLEQLVAESTGKKGTGIIPVDLERPGPPEVYGQDRIFAYLRLGSSPDLDQERAVDALAAAGHPVVRVDVAEPYAIGAEFFRWEIATAVAGAVIGINPFDQPDVEAAKVETRKLTDDYEKTGKLAPQAAIFAGDGVEVFADPRSAAELLAGGGGKPTLAGLLRAHLGRLRPNDYFALVAFLEMSPENVSALQALRHAVRDRKHVATCLGFGPRFLHSTGQAYKGGPDSGVFLQITCTDREDLAVPGQKYTFGVVKSAQARGDLAVLIERGRRALSVRLPADVAAGLQTLLAAVDAALGGR